jgi:NAD(P)-dependent dehydrogenase (short-subunit alcohol dehydrogenase family)
VSCFIPTIRSQVTNEQWQLTSSLALPEALDLSLLDSCSNYQPLRSPRSSAIARNIESDAIKQLEQKFPDRFYPVSASVDSNTSVQKAVETVKSKLNGDPLDVLVNNAGINSETKGGLIKDMELDQLTQIFDVNVVGVQRVTAAFFPLLEQGSQKKVVNMYVH